MLTICCLHASASSPGQWNAWLPALGTPEHVLTPPLIGYGPHATWPPDAPLTLDAEVNALAPLFTSAAAPLLLIGHSYGGAVALRAALRYRSQVCGLVLYEPVAFHLPVTERPDHPATQEIQTLRRTTSDAVRQGDLLCAAQVFIDYWLGTGSWAQLPPTRQQKLAAAMPVVVSEWDAVFNDPTTLDDYRQLDLPVLYLLGSDSPLPPHLVADLLLPALPQATTQVLDGLGHMAPVTDPERVLPAVTAFLGQLAVPPATVGR